MAMPQFAGHEVGLETSQVQNSPEVLGFGSYGYQPPGKATGGDGSGGDGGGGDGGGDGGGGGA